MGKHEQNEAEQAKKTAETEEASPQPEVDTTSAQSPSETEQLQTQLDEQKDKYVRLMAEFENYKKRTSKERIEFIQTAGKDIIVSLLDVLDDCDRAEKQMQSDTDIKHVKEGAILVFNKLRSVLQAKGVKALESIHNDFDVEGHEAVAEVPGAPEMSGKVIDEVQKGYTLNDKLIRFAKVVVGK